MSLYQKERTQTPPERWKRLVCTGLRGFWLVSPLGYLQSLRYLGIETYGLQTSLLLYSHCCGITPQRENGNDHQASRGTENRCVLALTTTEGVPTSSAPRNAHWGHTTVWDWHRIQRTKSIPVMEQRTSPTEVTLTGRIGRQSLTQVTHTRRTKPSFHLNSLNTWLCASPGASGKQDGACKWSRSPVRWSNAHLFIFALLPVTKL